jgi:hypothetical protein
MDSKIIKLLLFFLLPINLYATEFQGSFKQGSFILGKTHSNSKVFIDDKKVRVAKDGYFVFGIGRDRKNNVIIKIVNNGKTEVIEKKYLRRNIKFKELMVCLRNKLHPQKKFMIELKQIIY